MPRRSPFRDRTSRASAAYQEPFEKRACRVVGYSPRSRAPRAWRYPCYPCLLMGCDHRTGSHPLRETRLFGPAHRLDDPQVGDDVLRLDLALDPLTFACAVEELPVV